MLLSEFSHEEYQQKGRRKIMLIEIWNIRSFMTYCIIARISYCLTKQT